MREETQDSITWGGDETIVSGTSQTPTPLATRSIRGQALERLLQSGSGSGRRGHSKTPTLTFVSKEELHQFAGHLGGIMGRFSPRVVESQNAMYLDIGQLSAEGQQQARSLGKLQCRLKQGQSILVEELEMFELVIGMVDQESKKIQADIVARVLAEFLTQQACQEEQAAHSQLQDEQLRDRILKIQDARANDSANYKSEMNQYKEGSKKAWKEQQGQHEAEMARLQEVLIELKAQVGAILAPRLVAPTIVTDNREQPVRNIHGAPAKRSNPTPEQEGGNEGGRKPPMTMHRAGDPNPHDGNDDDKGQDPKGGPSCKEKGK